MSIAMRTREVASAYDRWAPAYDVVFGGVFRQGRAVAVRTADRIGGRILEVGVGTGISLPLYRATSRLTGVDISEAMLAKALARVRRLKLGNVEDLAVMDAERLSFPDKSFDVAVAQYVLTAVPDPERALDELARVVRPGGEIVITTRIGAEHGPRRSIERALMPLTSRLGWRTDFPWRRYADWAAATPAVRLLERRPLPPLGHFWLVRFEKCAG